MEQTYLQISFEIKAMCDELSRRLLRWHWEQQEGRTMRQLVEHVARRTEQAPDYFGRMQELSAKSTWQQLDTTLCMRVLLDPGDGAGERPLRLLSTAPRPVLARQSCNGLRMARNAAAHATDLTGTAEAAAAFAEAVEKLDEGYGGAVFTDAELEKYRKAAARAVNLCREAAINQQAEEELPAAQRRGAAAPAPAASGKKIAASTAKSSAAKSGATKTGTAKSSTGKSGAANPGAASGKKPASGSKAAEPRSGSASRSSTSKSRSTAKSGNTKTTARSGKKRAPARKRKAMGWEEWYFLVLAAVVFAAALYLRGQYLGLFG